jgi:hypothetical protein
VAAQIMTASSIFGFSAIFCPPLRSFIILYYWKMLLMLSS